MKGILLCGGMGTRLWPLTTVVNKHLLPCYDRPMVYWPIQTLVNSGITDIMIICDDGDFLRILGNGEQFGLKHLAYTYQPRPLGVAHALGLAEEWAKDDSVCLVLGDNIFETDFKLVVNEFDYGAKIFVTPVDKPWHYGVVELLDDEIISIEEKPASPKSNLIAVGLYMYDNTVWDYIRKLEPSKRRELEITDLNNYYLQEGKLQAGRIQGFWADAGESIDTYLDVCLKVRNLMNRNK